MVQLPNDEVVQHLKYLVRCHDGLAEVAEAAEKRLKALGIPEVLTLCKSSKRTRIMAGITCPHCNSPYPDGMEIKIPGIRTMQNRLLSEIQFYLPLFDIYEKWLKFIPGIGTILSAKLILFYYFKCFPVCKECGGDLVRVDDGTPVTSDNSGDDEEVKMKCTKCGTSAKGGGILKYRIERRHFNTVSKWWKYMGVGVDPKTGKVPRKVTGETINWKPEGRRTCWMIGDQFNKQTGSSYNLVLKSLREKVDRNHGDDWSKGHCHNAAKQQTVKIFLSHFWTIARVLDELPVSMPYAMTILGHTNFIAPFYWEETILYSNVVPIFPVPEKKSVVEKVVEAVKKRGRKPKEKVEETKPEPKKRGRKPKVA